MKHSGRDIVERGIDHLFTHEVKSKKEYPEKCSYIECLQGHAHVPEFGAGRAIFILLMTLLMCSIMTTFNGVLHSGIDFFASAIWMYPLSFCSSLVLRIILADRIIRPVVRKLVVARIQGVARNFIITLLNVVIMSTIMTTWITVLLSGFSGLWENVASALPVTYLMSFSLNFLIVSPVVKMLYNNVITPAGSIRFMRTIREGLSPIAVFFGD